MSASLLLRSPMLPVGLRARAYFAPVDRGSGTPAVFDPAQHAQFSLDAPPPPWISAGWIENLTRSAATRVEPMRAGSAGAVAAQFRSQLEARIEFDFCEWGKLQMALSGGSQQINVLAEAPAAVPMPSGGAPIPAIPLATGSTSTQLLVASGTAAALVVGDMIAVDVDYTGQTGYVGSGIAAAWVQDPADVQQDPNYIRRVTFNVSRIADATDTALVLAQPLLGGAPASDAKIQKLVGFLDREGGSFFQEWSGLFVLGEESGAQVCFYYPRLQACAPEREAILSLGEGLNAHTLHASMVALPIIDPHDGEQAVCFRSFFPALSAALY